MGMKCRCGESNQYLFSKLAIKKIRDIKGPFHAKMGTIKDRNGMDLTKVDNTKKTW